MRFRTFVAVPFIALSLASCGSSGGDSSSDATLPAGTVVITAIEGIAWDKPSYRPPRSTARCRSPSRTSRAFRTTCTSSTRQSVDVGIDLEVNGRNDIDSTTVPLAPGDYKVICTIAGHANMKATLTVT